MSTTPTCCAAVAAAVVLWAGAVLQSPHRAKCLLHERNLHDDLVGQPRQLATVAIGASRIDGLDCGEDRAVHEARELFAALLGQ